MRQLIKKYKDGNFIYPLDLEDKSIKTTIPNSYDNANKQDIANWLIERNKNKKFKWQLGDNLSGMLTNLNTSVKLTPIEFNNLTGNIIENGEAEAYNKKNHVYYSTDDNSEVHETTHGLNNKNITEYIDYIINPNGDKKIDPYWDSGDEIYSRLMEFRINNKLDPNKTYSKKEIQEFRNRFKDKDPFNLFNRYNDEELWMLLNKVASNNLKNNNIV